MNERHSTIRRNPAHSLQRRGTSRRAMVLVLVLVVIALLALGAYTFCELMLSEHEAADAHGRRLQARALAESGIEQVLAVLSESEEAQHDAGGIYSNPSRFQGVLVVEDDVAEGRGRFAVVAPPVDEGQSGLRFGLEDESARLNVNALLLADKQQENGGRTLLMALPGMTEDIADSIMDWIDSDDEIREFGAELEYYSGLSPPYAPKNAPLDTVEELLLVRGMTPELLFGPDANRNGALDRNEASAGTVGGADNSDGSMNRGWSGYLTLYSLETNVRPDGTPRIDVNGSDMETLFNDLNDAVGEEWATYIVAYRQNGAYSGTATTGGASGKLDLTASAKSTLSTVLDLIGTRVQVKFDGARQASVIESPFADDPAAMVLYLPKMMDNLTAGAKVIPGRININQAPRAVLAGIPGLDEEKVEQIVSSREPEVSDSQPGRRYETWILSEGIVTLDEMKALIPYVCAGGRVFRAQVVGYYDRAGPAARIEAIVDATASPPQLLSWRDISHLGRGYPAEVLGIQVDEQP